jgi:hypothetical protein
VKVLVVVPTLPVQPYIHPLTYKSVLDVEWDRPYEVLLMRNDMDTNPPMREGFDDLLVKVEKARDLILARDYEAMLLVEADMVIPRDVLKLLSQVKADIVYALYCSRHSDHFWMLRRGEDLSIKLSRDGEFRRSVWGQVVESDGLGFGCTLIRRRALKIVSFRLDEELHPPDFYFAKDAARLGVKQMTHCGVRCGHIARNKVIYPDKNRNYRAVSIERALNGQ